MPQTFRHNVLFAAVLGLMLSLGFSTASAQYYAKNALVRNTGTAKHIDPQLVNPWGLVYRPGSPFWVSDAGSGLSTLYDGTGVKQGLVVTIPPASGTGKGSPTGIVYNGSKCDQPLMVPSRVEKRKADDQFIIWNSVEPL